MYDLQNLNCYIFVRFSAKWNITQISNSKLFYTMHLDGLTGILKTNKANYKIHHDWLISHPSLSIFSEIQLIKPKNG